MMADDMESDTCVGFKRRITEIEEDNQQQQQATSFTTQEDLKESFVIVSSPKQEQEAMEASPKKVKSSFIESETHLGDNQELGFVSTCDENQGMLDCVCEKIESFGDVVKETEISEVGFEKKEQVIGFVKSGTERTVSDVKEEDIVKSEMGFQEFEKVIEEKKSVVEVDENVKSVVEVDENVKSVEFMEAESFLEAKKKQLLKEIEVGSIFVDKTHLNKVIDDTALIESVQESGCQEVHKLVQNDAAADASNRCSLQIKVIDDTALIESVPVAETGNDNVKEAGVMGFAKDAERKGKNNEKQEVGGKKARRSRRKAKDAKMGLEMSQWHKNLTCFVEDQNGGRKNGDGTKRMYSREEMEALRFVNIVEQRKMWKGIYTGLAPAVVKGYNDLASSKHQKQNIRSSSKNFDPWQQFGRKEDVPGILSSEIVDNEIGNMEDNEIENVNSLDPACSESVLGEAANEFIEGECSEDDDSDEDYASFQKPAFLVEGEPNFDSGPPEDGLEYLRRVRWEAARIPNVKVAKFDRSKLNKEQSVYMPQIPDIAKCPEHLLPLKQWEDAFLADFSELRLALSRLNDSSDKISGKLQSAFIVQKEKSSSQLPENIIIEKFNNLRTDEIHYDQPVDSSSFENSIDQPSILNAEDHKTSESLENLSLKTSVRDNSCSYPTLSTVLGMSSVAQVSMLRKRISSIETMSTLSRSDCAWLFALCAAVDTPLDADTCASLRSLLRKCASLRAEKSELDDEVVMLNILATISGRYFGQLES